jgi:hypothetical protein
MVSEQSLTGCHTKEGHMRNEDVLARIHLDAILSNFEILAQEDQEAGSIAGSWNGSILFMVGMYGPRSTLEIRNAKVKVMPGRIGAPDIVLFFPTAKLLNNMFTGTGVGFPIPLKGVLKAKGLLVFMKLAKRMEAILKGDNPPKALKAELLVNTLGRTIAIIAAHEPESRAAAQSIRGVTELRIKNGAAVNITFSGAGVTAKGGNAPDPDLVMEFGTQDLFLDLADDKVDVFAAICLEDMVLQGDLHMGDVVNTFLDKVGVYLQ